MSSLTYDILEFPFNRETEQSVKDTFGSELGKASLYPVYVSLKTTSGWTGLQRMVYDTGAVVSLLPSSYYDLLEVEKHARGKLGAVVPGSRLDVRLARAAYRFVDLAGNSSDEYQAWFAFAERDDVPRIMGLKDVSLTHRLKVDAGGGTFTLEF